MTNLRDYILGGCTGVATVREHKVIPNGIILGCTVDHGRVDWCREVLIFSGKSFGDTPRLDVSVSVNMLYVNKKAIGSTSEEHVIELNVPLPSDIFKIVGEIRKGETLYILYSK